MISTILITILALSFFSAESLVTMIVGFIVSAGVTQWLKNQTGVYGTGAAVMAFAIAFVVAALAVVISTLFSGGTISWETIPQAGLQIFALATMAYRLFMSNESK